MKPSTVFAFWLTFFLLAFTVSGYGQDTPRTQTPPTTPTTGRPGPTATGRTTPSTTTPTAPRSSTPTLAPGTLLTPIVADTLADTVKPVFYMSLDLDCDSFIANCDSIQAAQDPCFAEFMQNKRWAEDCAAGAIKCTITIRPVPIVVDAAQIHARPTDSYRLWLFLLLSFQFIVVVYVRVAFYKQLEDIVRAYFNINLSQQIFREQELSQPFSGFLLNINFMLSATIYVYLVVSQLAQVPGERTLWMLGVILGLITAIYVGKYLLMRITAWIFPFSDEMNFYAFNFFINQKLLGVLLIPFNFMIAYSPEKMVLPVIIGSLIVISTAFLTRSIRGLLIAKNYLANYKFYFFVYICTLEVAPVLIIIKIILSRSGFQ